jgi:SAM-dependent methyltransferase
VGVVLRALTAIAGATPSDAHPSTGHAIVGVVPLLHDGRYYDAFHTFMTRDIELWRWLAGPRRDPGCRILELGCGTGRVTIPLARDGHDVTGIDTSASMLETARHKATAENPRGRVTFVQRDMRELVRVSVGSGRPRHEASDPITAAPDGDAVAVAPIPDAPIAVTPIAVTPIVVAPSSAARIAVASVAVAPIDVAPIAMVAPLHEAPDPIAALDSDGAFDLVIAPFNVLRLLIERDDLERMLAGVRRALRSGGRFAFDVTAPVPGQLVPELPVTTHRHVDPIDGTPIVATHVRRYDRFRQVITLDVSYQLSGGRTDVDQLVQRVYFPQELFALLAYNGFDVCELYGDYDRRPIDASTPQLIVVATVSAGTGSSRV